MLFFAEEHTHAHAHDQYLSVIHTHTPCIRTHVRALTHDKELRAGPRARAPKKTTTMAAAAPPASTAAPAGPRLRFCPESNDLLYPQEDKERKVSGACVLREQEAGRGDGRIGQQKNSTRPPHLKQTRPRFPDPPSSCASLLFCKGPHLCLPQLRVPGGRPPFRLVRVPQRNHALRPGAHRVHSRCPRRPDPALHPGRGLPGVRARGGRLLFGAVGGGDDAVLYVHGVRAPVAGLCVRRAGRGGEGRESFFVERERVLPQAGVF
jgi:hypothetical protein